MKIRSIYVNTLFQAVEEVNRNNVRAGERLYELKALQDAKKAAEYLALCRTLPGYGDVVFPHCASDSRKEGHVIPAIGERFSKIVTKKIFPIHDFISLQELKFFD